MSTFSYRHETKLFLLLTSCFFQTWQKLQLSPFWPNSYYECVCPKIHSNMWNFDNYGKHLFARSPKQHEQRAKACTLANKQTNTFRPMAKCHSFNSFLKPHKYHTTRPGKRGIKPVQKCWRRSVVCTHKHAHKGRKQNNIFTILPREDFSANLFPLPSELSTLLPAFFVLRSRLCDCDLWPRTTESHKPRSRKCTSFMIPKTRQRYLGGTRGFFF